MIVVVTAAGAAPTLHRAAAMRRPQPLKTVYCMTEIAQQPPLGGCPPIVAADDCVDSLDFCACISWLDHSTGADHRSRAFQLTPSVALSLSLSLCWAAGAVAASAPADAVDAGQGAAVSLVDDVPLHGRPAGCRKQYGACLLRFGLQRLTSQHATAADIGRWQRMSLVLQSALWLRPACQAAERSSRPRALPRPTCVNDIHRAA